MTPNNKMDCPRTTKRRLLNCALALTLAAASLFMYGCGDCEKPRNVSAPQLPAAKARSDAASAPQLVVYLDNSKSMKGYVGKAGSETTFSRTLQELRNFVTLVNPPLDVLVRRVDTSVGQPLNNTVLSTASVDNKEGFTGNDTDLAGAFDTFRQSLDGKEGAPPPRFHVLITDGVQSASKERADLACTTGSDQLCVRRRISDLLNAGWGGCVIALRSEFHGDIYSEVNRAAHLPSVVPYESDENDPQSLRPFYLYVFSPDRNALEPFVATLLERLKPLASGRPEALRVLPLSFRYADAATQSEPGAAPEEGAKGLVLRRAERADIPEFTVEVDPSTTTTGAQAFTVPITIPWARALLDGNPPGELAQIIRWELKPVYPAEPDPSHRYAEVKFVRADIDNKSGRLVAHLTAQWLPNQVGTMCWRGYRLEGRLQPEQQTPDWIRAWSTNLDTTRREGNRTLYLESTLLGLWRNPVLDGQLVAEAVFVAGKP